MRGHQGQLRNVPMTRIHTGIANMIEFEVSRDPGLLQQYYSLRERCFRTDLGIESFDGSEEPQDQRGQILLAHINGRVIGGARISSEVPASQHITELNLARPVCCVWERFVLDPGRRSINLAREFLARLIEVSHLLGYEHALMLSSLRNARFYRACHTALGITFEIHKPVPEFATGEFAGLEHYLSVAYLSKREQLHLAA